MATASRQASSPSDLSAPEPSPLPTSLEEATVEESAEDFDLLGILRKTVLTGTQSIDAILASVADAARVMSGADGTALALDTKGTIICRARSGEIAPGLGAAISSESGISGVCLRTASMLVCHDTLSDTRVDAEVCSALGIRSIAAVPLLDRAKSVGILEAFSGRPNAFDGEALSSLRSLAEIAQIAHCRELSPAANQHAPANTPAPVQRPPKYVPRTFTTEELAPVAESRKIPTWLVTTIAVGLFLAVIGAWWGWHSEDGSGSTPTAHAATTVASANAKPISLQVLPKPAPGVSGKHSDSQSRPDIVMLNAADLQRVESSSDNDVTITTDPPQPRTKPVTDPDPGVTEAPVVSMTAPADKDQIARLTSSEAQLPAGLPVVSQGVVEPVLQHRVDPTYPFQARAQRLSGKVTVSITIGTDGAVRNLVLVSGSPILAEAAKAAVRQWHYRPATLNGNPVEIQQEINFVFAQP